MKLTKRAIVVLKNFSTINSSICFDPGTKVRTISPTKTILATADLDMEIEKEFCINDLSRFISALSLFPDPTLDVTSQRVIIKSSESNASKISYACAESEFVLHPPNKVNFPTPDIKFTLTNDALNRMTKAMGVLGLADVAIRGEGGTLSLRAIESKISDNYSLDIGKTNQEFNVIIKLENLKLIPADYSVEVGKKNGKGISKFSGIDFPIEYFVAVDSKSEFVTNETREPALG